MPGVAVGLFCLSLSGLISNDISGRRVMVPFHVPIELAFKKKERAAQVTLELGRVVVDKVSVDK